MIKCEIGFFVIERVMNVAPRAWLPSRVGKADGLKTDNRHQQNVDCDRLAPDYQ